MSSWVVPGFAEERELGAGASGRVVAAVAVAGGARVAIKYLSPRLLIAPGFVEAFRAEASLLRALDVPQVARLLGYVEAPGQGAAIIMELVDGVSLHDMITRQGPTSPEAALLVLKGSLLGLAAAHALGIVHRDYKPENVLVDGSGQSKLTDFGVAARAGQAASGGTPLYMAPEQWRGGPASPATDIYAAAAVFFECLTGMTPFSGQLGQLAAQHEHAAVPVELVGEPLRPLVARGMAKDPAARPANAAALVAELEATAAAACGPGWEAAGRAQLTARAAGLLALASGTAGGATAATGAGSGTATATTWLSTVKGAIAAHPLLSLGIAAALAAIAGAAAGITRAAGPPASITVAASSPATSTAASGTAVSSTAPPASPPAAVTPSVAPGTTPAPGPTLDLAKVDWQAVSIPGSWFKGPASVTLHASSLPGLGEADNVQTQIPSPQGGGPEVETVYADSSSVVYGTLDGTPMAALEVQVQAGGTADSVRAYGWVVYSGSLPNLTLVGVITAKSGLPNEWSPDPTQAPNVTLLQHVTFEGSEIVANEAYYKANDPTAGPSGKAVTTWALQGGTLVPTGTQILQ